MFERTLQDLIRGLRAHKASSKAQEEAFLAEALVEIREELKGKDMALKAEGVIKMCYLMMLYPTPPPPGFAFHVVEVMSSPRYHLKQLGYLASPMAFSGETEEVVLTVNGIKKDLLSPHLALPPLALTALPHLLALSPSLSNTLHSDLLLLLTHSSARIRKRAVLCLLPCWEAFPEGLREGFPRLREKLQDDDQGVVGATVGVVMELAKRQGGKNYLPLAPELFGILTSSGNNWMLIKVVKLFAILTPLEPRLVRKLLPPITNLISSTSAISLLYECVRTCIVGGMLDPDRPEGEALAQVCVEKLGGYLRDEGGDQNLRYIALLAMVKITPTHPHLIAEYQEEIMQSLDDSDVSIRMRALELVTSMVNRPNIQSVADQLLAHLAPPTEAPALPSAASALSALHRSDLTRSPSPGSPPPSTAPLPDSSDRTDTLSLSPAYRLLLAQRLLGIIAHDTYTNVSDFEWVISILVDVAYVSNVDIGAEIKDMLLDVVGRVRSVRGYAVSVLERALGDEVLREKAAEAGESKGAETGLLEAAVWICGEYPSHLSSALSTISSILSITPASATSTLAALSLQAAAKVFAFHDADISARYSAEIHEETKNLVRSVQNGCAPFLRHPDIAVQERAVEFSQLLSFVEADLATFKPAVPKANGAISGLSSGFEAESSDTPEYPKSLFLFQPLFTTHELNAVAAQAQEAVRAPDGLDLDAEIVPGGGFDDVEDFGAETESEAEQDLALGEGGGKGMEELRRVLREQDELERLKKGKKKGKGRKKEGELTAEETEAKEKRKAARRQRAKDDPYYLYDAKDDKAGERGGYEGADDDDVDDIPIVKLDVGDLDPAGPGEAESAPLRPGNKPDRPHLVAPTAPPPEVDRNGEMPSSALSSSASPIPTASATAPKTGLAAVNLNEPATSRSSSQGRFEEYRLDEKEDVVDSRGHVMEEGDVPVQQGEIEVVRVKRKKKKPVVKKGGA